MRCKVGDMAEVISEINKGSIVQCVEIHAPLSCLTGIYVWRVRAPWLLKSKSLHDLSDGFTASGLMADCCLRPIRPPETPMTVTRDDEVTA